MVNTAWDERTQMHGEIYSRQEKDAIIQISLESYHLNHTTLQAIKHTVLVFQTLDIISKYM